MPFQTNIFPHIENKSAARMLWNRGGKGDKGKREVRGEEKGKQEGWEREGGEGNERGRERGRGRKERYLGSE